jgi:Acetyltransferase (GNAT) family.
MDYDFITKLEMNDFESVCHLFDTTVAYAYGKEGIGHLKEEICKEAERKKKMFLDSLVKPESGILFLVAKKEGRVIGSISFAPCGDDIRSCTSHKLDAVGELGSLYILPEFQGRGIGSALIHAMIRHIHSLGIEQFCLDCGYKHAQQKWLRKFGEPDIVAKDYWGKGSDHMVWLCHIKDYL